MHKWYLIPPVFLDYGIGNNKADQTVKHYGNLLLFFFQFIVLSPCHLVDRTTGSHYCHVVIERENLLFIKVMWNEFCEQ